jgi:integrase
LWVDLRGEFLRWVKQTLRAADMYEGDLDRVEQYCKVRSIRQIDSQFVIGYRTWRLAHAAGKSKTRTVTPRTINREVGTLRNMLNKGVEWKRIGSNPIANLAPLRHDALAKERRALTLAEVQRLFDVSPEYLKLVWRMFMCTGIRKNELVELRWDDVDFDARAIVIRAHRAKNHKAREIPLEDGVHAMLVALHEQAERHQPVPGRTPSITAAQERTFSKEHVFVTNANTPWRNNLLVRFYMVCKRVGIEGAEPGGNVDIHSLRVTFTTLAIDGGANPKAIQRFSAIVRWA